jgi:tetratricopeptide (TPR) repeat protein
MTLVETETKELFANRLLLGAIINPGIIQVRVALIVAALIASVDSSSVAENEASVSAMAKDPCALALVPHEGNDKQDLEIIRLQTKVRSASDPTAWLEQLGWAFVAKARVSFDPGFYKLAEQCALCLENKKPGCTEALLLRAHVLHSLHKFKEAEAVAQELVRKRGLNFDYGVLGDALMEQGKLEEAVSAYQAMMDQKPGPQAYSRAAYIRWLKGDLPGAIELMSWAAGASSPRDPESGAWARVRLARYEWQARDTKKALELIDESLEWQPDYAPALLERGRVLLGFGKIPEAIEALKRAAVLNPLPEYQWTLSEALRAADRVEEAQPVEAELKRQGAANDPRTLSLYLATRGEDVPSALRLAKTELETRADVFTLDALAWAWMASADTEQAWGFAQRAVAEGTQDGRLFLHAGVIASAAGQSEKAATYLAKATAMQVMLLPSERKILADTQSAKPVSISGNKNSETQPSTKEKQ